MQGPQNVLDLIILLVLGWGALTGLRSGLVLALTSLVGLAASWAVAAGFTRSALAVVDARWDLVARIAAVLRQVLPLPASVLARGEGSDGAAALMAWLRRLPLPEAYRDQAAAAVEARLAEAAGQGLRAAADAAYPLLAAGLASVLTFLALFLLTRLLFSLLGRLLHGVLDAGPLLPLNRLSGAAFGALRNAALLALVLGVLAPTPVLRGFGWVGGLMAGSAYAPVLLEGFMRISPWLFGAWSPAGP